MMTRKMHLIIRGQNFNNLTDKTIEEIKREALHDGLQTLFDHLDQCGYYDHEAVLKRRFKWREFVRESAHD